MPSPSTTTTKTFVVGATGNTGKHLVRFLLRQNQPVRALCRSKEKLFRLLREIDEENPDSEPTQHEGLLEVLEGSIQDFSEKTLAGATSDCDAVVSCLGHTMDMAGMFGRKDRRLVTNSVVKLTGAMPGTARFILMGSEGVAAPGDDDRSYFDKFLLLLFRHLVTPHADNEQAAAHLMKSGTASAPEWCVVRPCDLQDGPTATEYTVYAKPTGSLFGSGLVTRATVAKFMSDLVLDGKVWEAQKHKLPVIHDKAQQ